MTLWIVWFIAASLVFIAEIMTGTIYLLVLFGALVGAGLSELLFQVGGAVSTFIAAILSAVGTITVYYFRQQQPNLPELTNDFDIGEIVQVERAISDRLWRVFYRGTTWEARSTDITTHFQTGDNAKISAKDGNVLLITPN